MNKHYKVLAVSMLATAIGGCAVTSQPIERAASEQRAQEDLASMFSGQEPLSAPLTLHQAMARAVKYNLSRRVQFMAEAVAQGQLDVSQYDMLPKLLAQSGYSWRDNDKISQSRDSATGVLSPSRCRAQ